MNELRLLFSRSGDAFTYRIVPSWGDGAGEARPFVPFLGAVERALRAADPFAEATHRSLDPATATAFAALVVSLSQFLYQIYRDRTQPPPAPPTVERIRIEVVGLDRLPEAERTRLLAAALDEARR